MLEQSIQAVSDLAKHSHVKNVSIRVLRTPWWNPNIIPDVAGVCVLGALHCVLQGMMFDLILCHPSQEATDDSVNPCTV